jgi:2'-5' RNA ligase
MTSDDMIRAFVAIPCNDGIRAQVGEVQRSLGKSKARVNWVPPLHLHLTLAFLGDVFESRVPDIVSAMESAAVRNPPFACVIRGLSYFGRPRNPRVVWAGLTGDGGQTGILQGELARNLEQQGVYRQDRPYVSHLTLARVRSGPGMEDLVERLEPYRDAVMGSLRVECIQLIRSHLRANGAEYEELATVSLRGQADADQPGRGLGPDRV